jgi:peroxiredoxin
LARWFVAVAGGDCYVALANVSRFGCSFRSGTWPRRRRNKSMNAAEKTLGITSGTTRFASRAILYASTVALAASVTINVVLAHRLRSLTHAQSARLADSLLKTGTIVPPFTADRLDGQQELISYQISNQPTVLYVFTPSCSWCARNMDNFKTLVSKTHRQYRFIGLSLSEEGLPQYVATNDLWIPVYSGLAKATKEAYKLGGTPETIVVSPEGRILQVWMGAYIGNQQSSVEEFFDVALPGLREVNIETHNHSDK